MEVFARSGRAFLGLAPYVVVGVLASEALKHTRLTGLVRRGCERQLAVAITAAALLGIASPLCTYGTIPLMLQLLRQGVPLAPLVTFLSTSSLMNPQLAIITAGGLGAELALVRVSAVAVFGLLLGIVIHHLPRGWVVNARAAPSPAAADTSPSAPTPAAPTPAAPTPAAPRLGWRGFAHGAWKGLEFVGFYFVLGVLVGAMIEVFVPGRWISRVFATGGWSSVLFAAALGVPLYACGGGAIPLVRSAMRQGMSKGAALSFLLVGPATRVTPLLSLTAVMKPRFVLLYVAAIFAFSLLAGVLYR